MAVQNLVDKDSQERKNFEEKIENEVKIEPRDWMP